MKGNSVPFGEHLQRRRAALVSWLALAVAVGGAHQALGTDPTCVADEQESVRAEEQVEIEGFHRLTVPVRLRRHLVSWKRCGELLPSSLRWSEGGVVPSAVR